MQRQGIKYLKKYTSLQDGGERRPVRLCFIDNMCFKAQVHVLILLTRGCTEASHSP